MITILGRLGFTAVILLALVGLSSAINRIADTLAALNDRKGGSGLANSTEVAYTAPTMREIPAESAKVGHDADGEANPTRRSAGQQSPPAGFEARYHAIPYWTLAHCVSGVLFMVLGPMQFIAASRNRFPRFHRWCGRLFFAASLVAVVSALVFLPLLPVFGSLSTRVGVVVASAFFLLALCKGYSSVRRRQYALHREWMIRAFAIGLGISTFRVLIPVLMFPPIRASFPEAWDTVVWLGFVINVAAAETWINLTRPPAPIRSAARAPLAALASSQVG
jgi:uncharacterized membrane protein